MAERAYGPYRDYSEEDKAAALAFYDMCGGIRKTAREFQIPEATVRKWVNGRGCANVSAQLVRTERMALADVFEDIAYRACEIAPGKMQEASFSQLMTGAGIATDKMRLLRDQSTSNTAFGVLTDSEATDRAAAIRAKALQRLLGLESGVEVEAEFAPEPYRVATDEEDIQ